MSKAALSRYFYLQSTKSHNFLTVPEDGLEPGTRVVLKEQFEHESSRQLWFEKDGTVRSKFNWLALSADDGEEFHLEKPNPDNPNQKWSVDNWKALITNQEAGTVAQLSDDGTTIIATPHSGEETQKFAQQKIPRRYFHLISCMSGMCLEAEAKLVKVKSGAKVVMGKQDGKDNELWFEDDDGILRSKCKNMGLICEQSQGAQFILREYKKDDPQMQWIIMPNKSIANLSEPSNVLDIKGRSSQKGAPVVVWQWTGTDNQQWQAKNTDKFVKDTGDDSD